MTKFDANQRTTCFPLRESRPERAASLDLAASDISLASRPGVLSRTSREIQRPLKMGDRIVAVDGGRFDDARQYIELSLEGDRESHAVAMVQRGKRIAWKPASCYRVATRGDGARGSAVSAGKGDSNRQRTIQEMRVTSHRIGPPTANSLEAWSWTNRIAGFAWCSLWTRSCCMPSSVLKRCNWAQDELSIRYHDDEWVYSA